jgi:hypothetical protein
MFKRISLAMVLALLMISVLTACGGGAPAPVTVSQLPLFAGATESTNEALTGALAAMTEAVKGQNKVTVKSVEGKTYDLPAGTTFDALVAFYKPALEKAGWEVAEVSAPAFAFTRGKQALTLLHADGIGLVVLLSEIQ